MFQTSETWRLIIVSCYGEHLKLLVEKLWQSFCRWPPWEPILKIDLVTDEAFDIFKEMLNKPQYKKFFVTNLKQRVADPKDPLTQKDADEMQTAPDRRIVSFHT